MVTDDLAVRAGGRWAQFNGPRAPTVVEVLRGTTVSCSTNCGQLVSDTVVLVGLVKVTVYDNVEEVRTTAGAVTAAVNVAKVAASAAAVNSP